MNHRSENAGVFVRPTIIPPASRTFETTGLSLCAIRFLCMVRPLVVACPNLNAYAERWVRSIKEDCLNNLFLLGGGSLRHAVSEYVEYYNHERPHQGLNNELIESQSAETATKGPVRVRSRLGGLLNFYHR